jgi:hypothetical protein
VSPLFFLAMDWTDNWLQFRFALIDRQFFCMAETTGSDGNGVGDIYSENYSMNAVGWSLPVPSRLQRRRRCDDIVPNLRNSHGGTSLLHEMR